MQKKISRWRQEHKDWEALAAFALSKNTGRRFKKKPPSDSDSMLDVSFASERVVSDNNRSNRNAASFSDCVAANEKSNSESVTSGGESCPIAHGSSDDNDLPKDEHELNILCRRQNAPECSVKQNTSDVSDALVCGSGVKVKHVSLDELSDDELFLPPPDKESTENELVAVSSAMSKTANSFFVVSDDEDSSDNERAQSKVLEQNMSSSSDDDDDDDPATSSLLQSSIKSSTMFARSLSHRNCGKSAGKDKRWQKKSSSEFNHSFKNSKQKCFSHRNEGERFSNKQFTRSGRSLCNMRGGRSTKNSDKFARGYANLNTKYVNPVKYDCIVLMS